MRSGQHDAGAETGGPPAAAIDVAIVNWNTGEAAVEAARAYRRSEGVETTVTIVDNDSAPSQRELLRGAAGEAFELIEAPGNLGFGSAANMALAKRGSEYVVVSNADIRPDPGAMRALVAAARAEPRAGMVAPSFGPDMDSYHDTLPGPFKLLVRTFIGRYGRERVAAPAPGTVTEVEQPSGACFLMRRETWAAIGGFDESFFLWYEDVDLARRLHDAGRVGLVVGDARVAHQGAESFSQLDGRRKQAIRLASLRTYLEKHHPRAAVLARPLLWLSGRLRSRGVKG